MFVDEKLHESILKPPVPAKVSDNEFNEQPVSGGAQGPSYQQKKEKNIFETNPVE